VACGQYDGQPLGRSDTGLGIVRVGRGVPVIDRAHLQVLHVRAQAAEKILLPLSIVSREELEKYRCVVTHSREYLSPGYRMAIVYGSWGEL